jgi:hypothetical protein
MGIVWLHLTTLAACDSISRTLSAYFHRPEAQQGLLMPAGIQNVESVVLEALAQNDKTKIYQCPNGHKYVVGECGKTMQMAKCHCGADIGGTHHQLVCFIC